jgi:transcriptional regulator with XRE-family HTH domain
MMFESLAEELKQARIKRNLTLQQLSTKTRIDIKFIEAIEAGDFSFLPELYVVAFTKQYAKAVDLDEDIIIKKYQALKKGVPYEEGSLKQEEHEETKPLKESKETSQASRIYDAVRPPQPNPYSSSIKDSKRLMLGIALVSIVAIAILVYFLFLRPSNEIIVPEKPIEEVIKENKQRYIENEKPDTTVNNSIVRSDSLNLTIQANDTSWVKIILDDSTEDEFILFPKSQKTILAENNYKITFGNSGSVVLTLNNKSLNFAGKKGSVKYVYIDKNGLKYLNTPPSL